MHALAVLALTFLALSSAVVLLGTVGRRRRTRRHASLPAETRRALLASMGVTLTELVAETRALRARLDAIAANGRDMVEVENALGRAPRRPLWRQLEDSSYEHDLERAKAEIRGWLARVDALSGADRQILDEVGPSLGRLRTLLNVGWTQPGPGVDRRPGLIALEEHFADATAVLGEFESRLESYRPRAYR